MAEEQCVLIIGATGYIGRYIANASVASGHRTLALVRPNPNGEVNSKKSKTIDSLQTSGVEFVHGSLEDYGSLVTALKNVDIVISAVGISQVLDQLKLVEAMQQVKTVKRFIPSEFGMDVDEVNCLKPCQEAVIEPKVRVRRATEAAGVPHTYVVTGGFAKFHFNMQEKNGKLVPPSGTMVIFGDGNIKASFAAEEDIGTYVLKAASDVRTLNKTLHIRPPANALSQKETSAVIESVTKQSLQKQLVSNEELLRQIEEASGTFNALILSFMHSTYIKGDCFSSQLGPNDLLAHELYPEVSYTDADAYLRRFV